jgi:hypothetical protein
MELNLDEIEYRVVPVDPESRRILVHKKGTASQLLRVSIPVGTRAARRLRTEMLRQWGMGVVVLDYLSVTEGGTPCVVVELLTTSNPVHFPAVRAAEISNDELSDQERMHLLRVLEDEVTSPFCRIGWMREAIAWVECATAQRLCRETGVEQHNAGGAFTLLHLSMESGKSYWLKATGDPNSHERQMTRVLSTLCPPCLPHIVAEKPEWNAWLMTGEGWGLTSLPTDPDNLIRLLGPVAQSLAEIQIETTGKESLLFGAGAFDQRLNVIRANANILFAYIAEAMSLQTSTTVPRISAARLEEMRELLESVCDRIEHLDIPSTILHGDMNLGNLVFTENRCQFIDWSEGYVGHPLVTFQHLLLLNPIKDSTAKTWVNDALKAIYGATMRAVCDPRHMTEGFACMGLLAAASALYGRGDWFRGDLRYAPRHLAYVRCIARHMDRSAREPAFLEALCAAAR